MFTELKFQALDSAPRSLALGQALPCHRTQNVAKTMVASSPHSAIYRDMFALGTLAFIGISLFMVHEFEEMQRIYQQRDYAAVEDGFAVTRAVMAVMEKARLMAGIQFRAD